MDLRYWPLLEKLYLGVTLALFFWQYAGMTRYLTVASFGVYLCLMATNDIQAEPDGNMV